MYFIDRTSLGKTLAGGLADFRGKDAVILCLTDSSLLTCLTIAMQLRAWVYPLVSAPVYGDDTAHQLLGAFGEDETFCSNPEGPFAAGEQLPPDIQETIEQQKPAAVQELKRQLASYEMVLDKHQMDGRDVIIVGDIVTSPLPIALAQQLLSTVHPKSLTVAVGNTTPDVADLIRLSADRTKILDVISGVVADEEHYFQHTDSYTSEQKHTLTQHIATYWQ